MAEYVPITDQEIEPEAPLTSILQHKLRDNPIAITEGANGAPKVQTDGVNDSAITTPKIADGAVTGAKIAPNSIHGSNIINNSITRSKLTIGTGEISINFNSLRPSGALEVGFEQKALGSALDMFLLGGSGISTRGAYVYASTSGATYYNSYHSVSFINSWLFLLIDKGTSNIVGRWFCNHHPSYGQSSFFEHPFINIDTNIFDIFCINITKSDVDFSLKSQYPVGGTEYLDPLLNTFSDINPFRSKRGIIDAFLDNFNIDFSSPMPWLTDLFPVGNPDFSLGMDFIYTEIPEPTMVTRVGYSLK